MRRLVLRAMKYIPLLAALLLFALPLCAQNVAIVNSSFEVPATLDHSFGGGSYNIGAIPGWTISGGIAGLWQPSSYASLPDGKVVAYSNGASIAQDLGIAAQPNTIYTLSVYVGHRPDDLPTTYTISLNSCTFSGKISDIAIGTFAKQTLTCPALTGNLVITLSAAGAQANFDNVTLTSASAVTPQPISLTVKAMLLWCALCDQTDNVPVTGNLVIAQLGGPTATYNILSNGSVSASSIIDIAQDPLQFTLLLTDSSGAAQPGANVKLTFPRFELVSPGFTLGTISLGVVRLAHTTDAAGNPAVRIVDVSQFVLAGP